EPESRGPDQVDARQQRVFTTFQQRDFVTRGVWLALRHRKLAQGVQRRLLRAAVRQAAGGGGVLQGARVGARAADVLAAGHAGGERQRQQRQRQQVQHPVHRIGSGAWISITSKLSVTLSPRDRRRASM